MSASRQARRAQARRTEKEGTWELKNPTNLEMVTEELERVKQQNEDLVLALAQLRFKKDENPEAWVPWDGSYDKEWYDVRVNGQVYIKCWPNAGKMNAVHFGGNKFWQPEDEIEVRKTLCPCCKQSGMHKMSCEPQHRGTYVE